MRRTSPIASTLCLLAAVTGCLDPGCENTVLQDRPSPDGRRHAVVFARACGATTGFSTQVSVLTASRNVTDGGNVFVADSDHGRVPATAAGGPAVIAEWVDSRTLRIRFEAGARVFKREARHDDTDVVYVAEAGLALRP